MHQYDHIRRDEVGGFVQKESRWRGSCINLLVYLEMNQPAVCNGLSPPPASTTGKFFRTPPLHAKRAPTATATIRMNPKSLSRHFFSEIGSRLAV